jgi:hypothetical protein
MLTDKSIIVLKLSACYEYLDSLEGIEENKRNIFVGKFQKECRKFFDFFSEYCKKESTEIYMASVDLFNVHAVEFSNLMLEKVNGEEEKKYVYLLHCFCLSVLKDLERVLKEDKEFFEPLYFGVKKLAANKNLRGYYSSHVQEKTTEKIDKLFRNK